MSSCRLVRNVGRPLPTLLRSSALSAHQRFFHHRWTVLRFASGQLRFFFCSAIMIPDVAGTVPAWAASLSRRSLFLW